MRMTNAQKRLKAALDHGAQFWQVGDGENFDDDPAAHVIIAEFDSEDGLAVTWRPQWRTVVALRSAGTIDELPL